MSSGVLWTIGPILAMLGLLSAIVILPLWIGLWGWYYSSPDVDDGYEAVSKATSYLTETVVSGVTVALIAANEVILSVGSFGDVVNEFFAVIAVLIGPFVGTAALTYRTGLGVLASFALASLGVFVLVAAFATREAEES